MFLLYLAAWDGRLFLVINICCKRDLSVWGAFVKFVSYIKISCLFLHFQLSFFDFFILLLCCYECARFPSLMFQDAQKSTVSRLLEYKNAHEQYILLYIIYKCTKPGFNICFSMTVSNILIMTQARQVFPDCFKLQNSVNTLTLIE